MAESAGAVLHGFVNYGEQGTDRAEVKGVIFNKVGSSRHLARLKASVRDIPMVGHLPRDGGFQIHQRHLGLTVAEEAPLTQDVMKRLARAAEEHFDIGMIVSLAGLASAGDEGVRDTGEWFLPTDKKEKDCTLIPAATVDEALKGHSSPRLQPSRQAALRIAVARDAGFCFYYEDNLDLLRAAGFTIVRFSPLSDPALPGDVDAVYLGGGYPELYAARLAANVWMRRSVHSWSESGNALYAECGGLMYVSRGIYDGSGVFFEMCGILPFATRMKQGRVQLGYRDVVLTDDCFMGKRGERLRGHEFHYSEIVPGDETGSLLKVYSLRDQDGQELSQEGYIINNSLASYVHLHFGSNAAVAENVARFVRKIRRVEV
jgi:cobyrinic acid a,c-diamide synthase